MQEQIKLTYFTFQGRAEEARLCFYIGGIDFIDERLEIQDFLKQQKEGKFKFGQVPVLQIGDTQYAQSGAIMRYAAMKSGLYPQDLNQVLLTEQALLTIQEFREKVTLRIPENERPAVRKELSESYFPQWVPRLENLLKENGTGYFAGSSIGLADIAFYNLFNWFTSGTLEGLPNNLFQNCPLLLKLVENVKSHPKVAQWNKEKNQKK